MEVLFVVEDQALLHFQPDLVMCFLDQLEFQCPSRETLYLILPKLVLKISNSVIEEENLLVTEVKHFWDLETLRITRDEPTVYEKFTEDITHNGEIGCP